MDWDSFTITYDEIGNPLAYRDGYAFTWQYGRRLSSISHNGDSISYTYDPDGIRTSKTVNGTTTKYHVMNGTLLGQTKGSDTIVFLYDEKASKYGFDYNGTKYYYIFNVQGDVIGILNQSGSQIVSYQYDPWGKVLSVSGSEASTIGQINPIRYRGYYYDTETGFYYLQSRYYDPTTRRFLNADKIAGQLGDDQSHNIFAYCRNNPINLVDPTGHYSWGEFWNDLKGGLRLAVKVAKKAAQTLGEVATNSKFDLVIGTGFRIGADLASIGVSGGVRIDGLHVKLDKNRLTAGQDYVAGGSVEIAGYNISQNTGFFHPFSCDQYPEDVKNRHSQENCPNSEFYELQPVGEITIVSAELYVIIGANFSWTWDVDSFVENVVEIWTTDW